MRPSLYVVLLALPVASCATDRSEAGLLVDAPLKPAKLEVVSGDRQIALPSAALAEPLVVRVLDQHGAPVEGVTIAWQAEVGAHIDGAALTARDGTAGAKWTLGALVGRQRMIVSSPQLPSRQLSFLANDGATLIGEVIEAPGTIGGFAASVSRRDPPAGARADEAPPPIANHIIVSWRDGALNGARIGSPALNARVVAVRVEDEMGRRLARSVSRDDVELLDALPILLAARLRVRDTTRTQAILAALRADPDVADASLERRAWRPAVSSESPAAPGGLGKRPAAAPSSALAPNDNLVGVVPNDTGFFRQAWHYNMIDAPRAWAITTGSPRVIVAVIDDGIQRRHPALATNASGDDYNFVSAKTTQIAVCGSAGLFDFTEPGYGPGASPVIQLEEDPEIGCYRRATVSHGTHVAGTIAGKSVSMQGGVGIAPGVRIRGVRVLNGLGGSSSAYDLGWAMLYAAGFDLGTAANGVAIPQVPRAHIINMSLRWTPDTLLQRALAIVIQAGTLVVASAGNDRLSQSFFPGVYPGVVSVSAVGPDWELTSYSNVGTAVSLAAPGGEFRRLSEAPLVPGSGAVYSANWTYTQDGPSYDFLSGTSMAAPHVTGVAALVLSANPSLTAGEVFNILVRSATDMGTLGRDDRYGWGVVNAYRAVQLARAGTIQRPTRLVRLIDATTGAAVRSGSVADDGTFTITGLAPGEYHLLAGQDENRDGRIGLFGRRLGAAGSFARPTTFKLGASDAVLANVTIGLPQESEPNDRLASANRLFVGSYVMGRFNAYADSVDIYRVEIPTAGPYTFETAGALGSCGYALESDTFLTLVSSSGSVLDKNDDAPLPWGHFCSRISRELTAGTYYIVVQDFGWEGRGPVRGQYRLGVRAGQ